jgi:hypothetical protein
LAQVDIDISVDIDADVTTMPVDIFPDFATH